MIISSPLVGRLGHQNLCTLILRTACPSNPKLKAFCGKRLRGMLPYSYTNYHTSAEQSKPLCMPSYFLPEVLYHSRI